CVGDARSQRGIRAGRDPSPTGAVGLGPMIFTTKAEYGVPLLVELGRQHDGAGAPVPVSLKAIAEAEALPLAYLERIVALLKKAGLVEATRGAHGGYRLTRQPAEIHMDEVVLALEGGVAPMTCSPRTAASSATTRPTAATAAPPSCCGRASRVASSRRWPRRRSPSSSP